MLGLTPCVAGESRRVLHSVQGVVGKDGYCGWSREGHGRADEERRVLGLQKIESFSGNTRSFSSACVSLLRYLSFYSPLQ